MIDLSGFTGTNNYYKFNTFSKLVLTDGTKYLSDECGAYWLMDAIASHQKKEMPAFQVWTLAKTGATSASLVCQEDTGEPNIVSQEIEYTDFWEKSGLDSISLFCIDGVILLRSEY